jgi:hypothetical protein
MLSASVPGGIIYFCECGKLLGRIHRPFTEAEQLYLWDIILAHREHVRFECDLAGALRIGTTTQRFREIIPKYESAKV